MTEVGAGTEVCYRFRFAMNLGPGSYSVATAIVSTETHLVNNYAWISFNFGPTLLSWTADHAPSALRDVVEADRVSRERRGDALAQIYKNMITPSASERDRRTQVLWGAADFRLRFGREPEGMWLAETAVDAASLETDGGLEATNETNEGFVLAGQ